MILITAKYKTAGPQICIPEIVYIGNKYVGKHHTNEAPD